MTKKVKIKETPEIVLTDFYATWCEPCKMQDLIIDELKKKFGDKVKFEAVDIKKTSEIADRFKIHAVPTLIIQRNGIIENKFIGVTSKKVLENELNNLLRKLY